MSLPPFVLSSAIALIVTAALTPTARWIARRLGAVDYPGGRRVNRRPMPRLGGLAIFAGIAGALLVTLPLGGPIQLVREPKDLVALVPLARIQARYVGILLGATLMTLVGAADDVRPIDSRLKFLLIYACAAVLVPFGATIRFVSWPIGGGIVDLGVAGAVATVAWVGSLAIAVNSIDGVDGLAAGISAIAGGTLLVAALARGDLPLATASAAVLGAAIGFLRYNFNPARIIMGDGGSLALGYLLGALSVVGLLKTYTLLSVMAPVLAVPIGDTAWAIVRRARSGQPLFQPDRGHLHHRLLDRGLSQRQTVLVLYLLSTILALGGLAFAGIRTTALLSAAAGLAVVLLVGAMRLGLVSIGR